MKTLFNVRTIIGLKVRTAASYWDQIATYKHPVMVDKLNLVIATLREPEQVRASKGDANVLLYYKRFNDYHICVVVKRLNGEGFIITTYKTSNIKEGTKLWPK